MLKSLLLTLVTLSLVNRGSKMDCSRKKAASLKLDEIELE